MNPLRKTLFVAAAAGSLFLSTASPLLAAPTAYQATGPILEMTDTTITIMFKGSEKWTFSKDAATTGVEGLKVGDKVTVHYTMAAGSIEAPKAGAAPAKGKAKKTDKAPAAAMASPAAAASASPAGSTEAQKPVTESGPAASPAATPGH